MDRQAEAFVIEMRLRIGYGAADHALAARRSVIVAVRSGTDAGWGEFAEIPGYSRETVETALATLQGAPVTHSNPMALAAREAAELDLEARRRGIPLTELLGGSPGPVASGAVVARFGDVAGTVKEAAAFAEAGYQKVKIKVGPDFDVEPLAAVRRRLPDFPVAADANGSYSPGGVPSAVDGFGLLYLEQPYPAAVPWADFARLRTQLSTPLCLDESITGLPTLRSAIAAEACDALNVKPARFAGLRRTLELCELAVEHGLQLVAGGLLETGVGRGTALALARLPGFTLPADLSASARYWDRDLTLPPWELKNGVLEVSEQPGIGVDVDLDFLENIAISRHSLTERPAG